MFRTSRSKAASTMFLVPCSFTRAKVERGVVESPTSAAVCTTQSQLARAECTCV